MAWNFSYHTRYVCHETPTTKLLTRGWQPYHISSLRKPLKWNKNPNGVAAGTERKREQLSLFSDKWSYCTGEGVGSLNEAVWSITSAVHGILRGLRSLSLPLSLPLSLSFLHLILPHHSSYPSMKISCVWKGEMSRGIHNNELNFSRIPSVALKFRISFLFNARYRALPYGCSQVARMLLACWGRGGKQQQEAKVSKPGNSLTVKLCTYGNTRTAWALWESESE